MDQALPVGSHRQKSFGLLERTCKLGAPGRARAVGTLYLSEILGHSSLAITASIYQHTTDDRLAAAVRQVGDAIYGRKQG